MPILDARKMLGEKQKASEKDRVEVYKKILKRVHPVMRHFFTEKHHVPYWWFQMRLNYARSAAAMSMIGYVMGIGDRHVSNIMIDTVRGELVPIDFGIAFEAVRHLSRLPPTELIHLDRASNYRLLSTCPSASPRILLTASGFPAWKGCFANALRKPSGFCEANLLS